jgi:hypothetical protein
MLGSASSPNHTYFCVYLIGTTREKFYHCGEYYKPSPAVWDQIVYPFVLRMLPPIAMKTFQEADKTKRGSIAASPFAGVHPST